MNVTMHLTPGRMNAHHAAGETGMNPCFSIGPGGR